MRDDAGPGGPSVQFREERSAALQLAGEAVLVVQRTGDLSGRVHVRYATVDGSARAGEHYEAQAGDVVLEEWQASRPASREACLAMPVACWADAVAYRLALLQPSGSTCPTARPDPRPGPPGGTRQPAAKEGRRAAQQGNGRAASCAGLF